MSDGYCDVDFTDYSEDADPVDFYHLATVTARKAHICAECDAVIAKGDSYQRVTYKFEGAVSTDHVCAPCAETKDEFNFQIFGGSVWTHLREAWDNGAHVQSCIARLETARAKEHMRQQWLKWKKLDGISPEKE
jgi:hypothetical protein